MRKKWGLRTLEFRIKKKYPEMDHNKKIGYEIIKASFYETPAPDFCLNFYDCGGNLIKCFAPWTWFEVESVGKNI